MIGLYKSLVRPLLFRFDSEAIHDLLFSILRPLDGPALAAFLAAIYSYEDPALRTKVLGLEFSNPVGLAAGFDKNGYALHALAALGFGALELGTVTAQAQAGNDKPRIFRLEQDQALINRMGFPGLGADLVAQRLSANGALRAKIILGINLGKSRATALEEAQQDYLASFIKLKEYAHYFVVNVSSPNTPELRKLQSKHELKNLLTCLQAENSPQLPLLVKISPDLSMQELDEVVEVVMESGANGIIACNTSLSREGLKSSSAESGGLSGLPLRSLALERVRHIYRSTAGRLPIIGVGGIFNAADAFEYFKAGASLVQIYTALVYEGPGLIRRIKVDLARMLRARGLVSIQEIVGKEIR